MLSTVFSSEFGLSEDAGIRIYKRSAKTGGMESALRKELAEALESKDVSWMHLLCNDDYVVFEPSSEEEARAFARRVLWDPLVKADSGEGA